MRLFLMHAIEEAIAPARKDGLAELRLAWIDEVEVEISREDLSVRINDRLVVARWRRASRQRQAI